MNRRNTLLRLVGLLMVCVLALQLYFLLRVAAMAVLAPGSTSFERSELFRLITQGPSASAGAAGMRPAAASARWQWRQEWVDGEQISPHLARAVIASEDGNFNEHSGVEWEALRSAWDKNRKAQEKAAKTNERLQKQAARKDPEAAGKVRTVQPKLQGGSTITQQLAKNLFLGPERHLARKAQELLITFMLEAMLSKQRILEIYLNHVEWGEGVFGAQAASQRYFKLNAKQLGPAQAARLAVMLPAPKRFEKLPGSIYLASRASTIEARMNSAELPRKP